MSMTPDLSTKLKEAMAGLALREDLPVRQLLYATWIMLAEKGILTADDMECMIERAKGARAPGRGEADGHSRSGHRLHGSELVDEASEQSFPASDPPSYIEGSHRVGTPPDRTGGDTC